jgi:REP element-mobilizing transposase RayT
MKRNRQLSFVGNGFIAPRDSFGGALLTSNPKTKRPLDSKLPTHLVLRARESLLRTPKNFGRVNALVHQIARKYGIRIYEYANVGNHIHLIVRTGRRTSWAGFIRELTGRIALLLRKRIGTGRGRQTEASRVSRTAIPKPGSAPSEQSFWQYRPFTRIVRSWRQAFREACDYVELNRLEAEGHIRRAEIRSLAQLRRLFESHGWLSSV